MRPRASTAIPPDSLGGPGVPIAVAWPVSRSIVPIWLVLRIHTYSLPSWSNAMSEPDAFRRPTTFASAVAGSIVTSVRRWFGDESVVMP